MRPSRSREAETANSRSTAEIQRLTEILEQDRREMGHDIKASESHSEILQRRFTRAGTELSKAVAKLAVTQTEDEDLRKSNARLKQVLKQVTKVC